MFIYDYYNELLLSPKRWKIAKGENDYNIDDVFIFPNNYNFIMEQIFSDPVIRHVVFDIDKVKKLIPNYRLSHTVSLYFLGIMLAEKIEFNNFNNSIPLLEEDSLSNFLHHWIRICLFHDIGYAIEESYKDDDLEKISSLNKLAESFNFSVRLDDEDEMGLLQNYYKYRIREFLKADHGIVGAMLFYNSAMIAYAKRIEISKKAYMFTNYPILGDQVLNTIRHSSYSIARHNMWRADDTNKDKYIEYNLTPLIPQKDGSHLIKFSKDPLLFILCLIDSIEPIKLFNDPDIKRVLKNVEICIQKDRSVICLHISDKSNTMMQKAKSLPLWLDCNVCEENQTISFATDDNP